MGSKRFQLGLLFLGAFATLALSCKDENTTVYTKPRLAPPTNLRAFSASPGAVGLSWEPSLDRSKKEFGNVKLVVLDENRNVIYPGTSISKDSSSSVVLGLNEQNVYTFQLISIPSDKQLYNESDPVQIQWATATRFPLHPDSALRIYEFNQNGSSFCGLQFYNLDSSLYLPGVFKIDTATRKQDKIDIYFTEYPPNSGQVVLRSADLNPLLPAGVTAKRTRFSNLDYFAPNLNVPRSAPPELSTYTRDQVIIAPGEATSGKLFYAMTRDSNFVRVFVKLNTNAGRPSLFGVTTTGVKFIDIQFSYQVRAKIIYAKPRRSDEVSDRVNQ